MEITNKPIKIDKKWTMRNQRIRFDGGVHYIASIIEAAKGLEVFEIPMQCLNIVNYQIAADSLRSFVESMRQVMEADLEYPIILDRDGWVIDGRHRIAKALFEGRTSIKAVRFEENPPPAYYEDEDEDE